MTPEQKGSLPLRVEKLFYELQDRIFSDIVRRIKKTGEITSTADYQIDKLLILGDSTEFIEQEIRRLTGKTDPEMWELYDKVSNWEYVRYEDAYQQINGHFVPLEENEQVQQWAQAVITQTNGEIDNITQSLGMTVDMGGGKKAFTPLAQYYQTYLDRACMDIVTGSFDYNTVLRRVVKEMTASGLKTIDYASGYSCRAPVAARRAIMTGVSQLSAQINEMVAKDLGTDTYEVTWHAGHRPSHWWGGNVYTKQELQDICHLGDIDGLCGANCRHSYLAFIPGYSVRTYSPEQLRELEAKEQDVRTWNGRKYNAYEATQKQRQMETKMRSQRANIKQLNQAGASQDDIIAAQSRYLNALHQYRGFSSKMELAEQMERVYMDGLGRVIPGGDFKGKSVAKKSGSGIMNSGAKSGALTDKNDPLGQKRSRHAVTYYDSVRNSNKNSIVKTVSKNSGFSEAYISKVYDHVFENEYDLYGGKKRFDADYDMAESFRRLREGKNIQEHDIILLKHEHLEHDLMNRLNLKYDEAHSLAESKYNYNSALKDFKEKNNL